MEYKYESPVDRSRLAALSRYKSDRIIIDQDEKIKFRETYQRKEIPKSADDFYHSVRPEEEYRLDLLSYRHYQTPLLWWVIASANGITNPLTAPLVGDTLRIPALTTLYGNGGILL